MYILLLIHKNNQQNISQFVQIHFDWQRNTIMRMNFISGLGKEYFLSLFCSFIIFVQKQNKIENCIYYRSNDVDKFLLCWRWHIWHELEIGLWNESTRIRPYDGFNGCVIYFDGKLNIVFLHKVHVCLCRFLFTRVFYFNSFSVLICIIFVRNKWESICKLVCSFVICFICSEKNTLFLH